MCQQYLEGTVTAAVSVFLAYQLGFQGIQFKSSYQRVLDAVIMFYIWFWEGAWLMFVVHTILISIWFILIYLLLLYLY